MSRARHGTIVVLVCLLTFGSAAANFAALAEHDQEVPPGTCSVKHAFDLDPEDATDLPGGARPQTYRTDDYDCTGAAFAADGVEFARFTQPRNFRATTALTAAGVEDRLLDGGGAGANVLSPYVPPFTHFVILYKENHVFDDYLGDCKTTINASCDGVVQSTNHMASVPQLHGLAKTYALFDEYSTGTTPPSGPNHWWLFSAQSANSSQQQNYPATGTKFDRMLNHTAQGTTLLVNGDIYWMTNANNGVAYNASLGRADWLPVSRPGTGIPEELNYDNYTLYKQNDDDTLIRSSFEDFVNRSGLPAYTYIELFNDHPGTYQDIPKNDGVTGDLVNFVINDTRYHDNTVIVIAEDDTQNGANGPDHVSNTYRVPMVVVASEKHEKHDYVSHVAYNTTNVIALMERVLNNVAPGIIDANGNLGASTFPMRTTDQQALGDPLSDIWINSTAPPRLSASASATPTSGNVPLTVGFTATATGGVAPYTYAWTFGDGGTSTAQNPSHTYTSACSCVATVTITDAAAQTARANVTITAATAGSPLAATATGSPTSGQVPLVVSFTGGASGGTTPYNWTWTFGDGAPQAFTQNPSHTYNTPSNYSANLTVRDAAGNTSTARVAIAASPSGGTSPEPQARATPASGPAPLTVQFNASAVGGIPPYTYAWDLGDGAHATGPSPSHTYTSAGTYVATLTATDSGAASGSANVTISVGSSGVVLSQAFDDGSLPVGWNATGLWRVGSDCAGAASAPSSLQSNQATICDFLSGSQAIGDATSPPFDITSAAAPSLTFATSYHFADVATGTETFRVQARSAGGAWTTIWTRDATGSAQDTWANVTLDLSAFRSAATQVRFDVGGSGIGLNQLGWAVDDVTVSAGAASGRVWVNEMESNPTGTDFGFEYAELYNDGGSPIDVTGWTITANGNSPVTLTLSGAIAAHGYKVITSPSQWLDNTGESLTLRDAAHALIDSTPVFDDGANDARSWQRVPDGGASWVFRASTEGATNGS